MEIYLLDFAVASFLSSSLQTEVIEKVELLKNFDNHSMLKVHKLSVFL